VVCVKLSVWVMARASSKARSIARFEVELVLEVGLGLCSGLEWVYGKC
jgi:hypothetical protein